MVDSLKTHVEFYGAAGEVTGSRCILRVGRRTVLVDCGLFQGVKTTKQKNWEQCCDPPPEKIDAVVLTHAHLDHSGYLPRLWRQGFRGKVYCSVGTADLLGILLLDAAHLEEEQAAYANRTGYSHHSPALPLFTEVDVEEVLKCVVPLPREEWFELFPELSFRFFRAGHIIGASMIQFSIRHNWGTRLLTFSGDIGHDRMTTMRGPDHLVETDYLVLESTYGNRVHPRDPVLDQLGEVAAKTINRGGVLVIPAFAVGRAQELIYLFRLLEDEGRIKPVPVILDSPMASAATRVFRAHPEDHRLGTAFNNGGADAFEPRLFETTTSTDDSMLSCMRDGPAVIISASGMLTGGRILHHLKARLPDARNTILFAGYQAEGTKGRWLQDNYGKVHTMRIHHVETPLEAEVATIASLSAHADYEDLLQWLSRIKRFPRRIFLNHGEGEASVSLAAKITERFKNTTVTPLSGPAAFLLDSAH